MKATLKKLFVIASVASMTLIAPQLAFAQLTVNETFNKSTTSADWYSVNGACLTAGTYSSTGTSSAVVIPGCATSSGGGNKYYAALSSSMITGYNGKALPDPSGYGALRLTNGALNTGTNGNNETGLIAGTTVLPSANGLQFTFNTVTYGGNGYSNGTSASGADGISFFLVDASYYTGATATDSGGSTVTYYPVTAGAYGGSLGYDCSSGKGGGMAGAYIGLGIDEYGNFVNKSDNGNASDPNSSGASPSTIGLRGAGNITTAALTTVGGFGTTNGTQSPISAGPISSAQLTCAWGYYTYNPTTGAPTVTTATVTPKTMPTNGQIMSSTPNSTNTNSVVVWATVASSGNPTSYTQNTATYPIWTVMDYPIIAKDKLSGVTIYSQEASSATVNTSPSPSRNSSLSVPISYTLTLTSGGYLSLSYSISGGSANQVLPPTLISTNNGPIPANFLFGFSAGTGGGSNVHEITCFKAKQIADSSASASGNIPQNSKVQAGESIYLASYNPNNWTGSIQAFTLTPNADGSIAIASTPSWDANCQLTGTTSLIPAGSCPSGSSSSGLAPASRAIATYNDSTNTGVVFSSANMSTNEWNQFNADGLGALRVSYLEGIRTGETSGTFRVRASVLGDIIDSSPVWVGPPQLTQLELSTWSDMLYPTQAMPENQATTTYTQYLKNSASRLNVVYVGANDGMLHGFAAGSFSGTGTTATLVNTYNTGQEVMAYIPQLALYTIHSTVSPKLDYSATTYSHNDFVDATPGTGDLFYGGTWHTWLVGGLGVGSQANGVVGDNTTTMTGDIYAIDVTNPSITQTAANVASTIMGDWTSATITCANSNVSTACGSYMGAITGTPIIRRLHNGNWAAIFGNGLNSANGTAGIFIMEIASGSSSTSAPTITFDYIDTGVGASTANGKNGIAYVASADMEDDHTIEYVYGGDALGNLWRFDLTGYSSSTKGLSWVSGITNNKPFLLFSTPSNTWTDTGGTSHTGIQPITSAIAEESAAYNGQLLNMVDFGTGRMYPQTLTAAESTAPGQQAIYGIWDWNMAAWNKLSTTQYAASTTGPGGSPNVASLKMLTTQTLTAICTASPCTSTNATAYYESNNMVCYSGMSGSCTTSPNPSWGWYINLPGSMTNSTATYTEQIVYNPTIQSGLFFVNSTIGAAVDPLTCSVQPGTGFTYGVDAATGGATTPTFNTAAGVATTSGNVTVISLSAVGTPIFVTANGTNSAGQTQNVSSILYQTSAGQGGSTVINSSTATGKRVSWLELR